MSALTMKIPEPIIDPATSMVASNGPSRRWKPDTAGSTFPLAGSTSAVVIRSHFLRPCPAAQGLANQTVAIAVAEVDHQADCQPHDQADPGQQRQEQHHGDVDNDTQGREHEQRGAAERPVYLRPADAEQ